MLGASETLRAYESGSPTTAQEPAAALPAAKRRRLDGHERRYAAAVSQAVEDVDAEERTRKQPKKASIAYQPAPPGSYRELFGEDVLTRAHLSQIGQKVDALAETTGGGATTGPAPVVPPDIFGKVGEFCEREHEGKLLTRRKAMKSLALAGKDMASKDFIKRVVEEVELPCAISRIGVAVKNWTELSSLHRSSKV